MSFVESCLALVILAIAASLAVPSLLKARNDDLLLAAAHDVATEMHAARIRAINRNSDCRLRAAAPDSYLMECQTGTAWYTVDLQRLPRGLTLTANNRPEFHRFGNVAPTATFTVSDNMARRIQIVVNTGGRIRIQ